MFKKAHAPAVSTKLHGLWRSLYVSILLMLVVNMSYLGVFFVVKEAKAFGSIVLTSFVKGSGENYTASGTWEPQGGTCKNYKIQIQDGGNVLAEILNPDLFSGTQNQCTPKGWSASFSLPAGNHSICAVLIHSQESGADQNTSDCIDAATGGGTISGYKYEVLVNPYISSDIKPGSGWEIFLDNNSNSILDSGEVSTTTGSDGYFSFSNLEPGSYTLAEVLKSSWVNLQKPSSIDITAGTISTGNDFINYKSTCVPSTEICDGLDNDCDSQVDEDLKAPTQSCTVGTGICANTGTQSKTCNGSAGWSADFGACSATAGTPSTEVCNGLDDDCDGTSDEDLTISQECSVGIGACIRTGVEIQTCSDGSWGDFGSCSVVAGDPVTEICGNNIDDDCDGSTDENCVCDDGETKNCGDTEVGECSFGTQTCTGGVWGECVGYVGPAEETCDNLDNDCNGIIDNGVLINYYQDVDLDTYGNPLNIQQACKAPTGYVKDNTDCDDNNEDVNPGVIEICNGIDDNCDGIIDGEEANYDLCESFTRSAEITAPSEGQTVSGTITLLANLVDKDGDDTVQWAVRKGTCAAGTSTVIGNVDTFNDSFSWDGASFSATTTTTTWENGAYCFVFNPSESTGDAPIRLTRNFIVNNESESCTDTDGDEVCDEEDNCPNNANPDQLDTDGDGNGNVCDQNQEEPVISYDWELTAWTECSVACGGGTQTREFVCIKTTDGVEAEVDDEECAETAQPEESLQQACNTQACSSGGGGGGSGGGGGYISFAITNPQVTMQCVNGKVDMTLTWLTTYPADSRVVYDTTSKAGSSIGTAPNYGYAKSTALSGTQVTGHSVAINGLEPNTYYYFRPISNYNFSEVIGEEKPLTQTLSCAPGEDNQVIVLGEEGAPELVLTNKALSPVANPGAKGVEYEITVTNNGDLPSFNTVLTNVLPEGFTYTDFGGNEWTWALGDLNPGESKKVVVKVDIAPGVSVNNYVSNASVSSDNHDAVTAAANIEVKKVVVLAETGFSTVEFLTLLALLSAFAGTSLFLRKKVAVKA